MTLKEKIKAGKKIYGMHMDMTDIMVGRMMGLAGCDFIWIDLEHSYMPLEKLAAQIMAVHSGGTEVIVRAPQDDLTYTKKILEMGPDGIIFPMIRSAEQANARIASTLYPPYGTRGYGPMGAVDYGYKDSLEFVRTNHETMCRFIQIEHIDAVNALDDIIQNDYIDGYIFGPNDLSGSIKELCDVFGEHTSSIIKDVTERLHKAGKYVGLSTGSTDEAVFRFWKDLGIDMLSAGADFGMLRSAIQNNAAVLKKVMSE